MRSTKMSTMSPSLTSGAPVPPLENSRSATRPSDLRPTSMVTKSFAMRTIVPLTTCPSKLVEPPSDSSSSAANTPLDVSFAGLRNALPLGIQTLLQRSRATAPVGQPVKSGGSTALTHHAETTRSDAIAARSLRSAGGDLWPCGSKALALDECQSRGEGRIGIHVAGIERPGIGCGFKRCCRPFAVATVPLRHLGKNARFYSVDPAFPQLLIPPLRAGFRARGDEEFHRGVGADDRADVAAVEHRPRPSGREFLLEFQQVGPNLEICRHFRAVLARVVAPQLGIIEVGGLELGRDLLGGTACPEGGPTDRPVEQAGIEMGQAEMRRQPLGEGALARRRGTVDRDDEALGHAGPIFAPSPFINAAKPGKLVSIGELSSTATGSLVASPSTRNDMAMRWSRC